MVILCRIIAFALWMSSLLKWALKTSEGGLYPLIIISCNPSNSLHVLQLFFNLFIGRLVHAHDDGGYVHKFGRRIYAVLDASRTCFLVMSLPVLCVSVLFFLFRSFSWPLGWPSLLVQLCTGLCCSLRSSQTACAGRLL